MNMKRLTAAAALVAGYTLSAAVPEVTDVTMSQDDTRLVTITYSLADAPAVVTVDVQTNAVVDGETVWTSIGGKAVSNAKGDVWKKIEAGTHAITWRPDLSWPDHRIESGGARAVVTAWALDNTPDYMVVDLSATGGAGTQKYYPSAEFLPGGLLGNDDYRTTSIVMRKIMAKGVEWTMGSTTLEDKREANEATHKVTLTNNYYIGVFPVTQTQWAMVSPARPTPSFFTNLAVRAMRPVEWIDYSEIRTSRSQTTSPDSKYYWPNDPNPESYLGLLRARTNIDFDLPSEAQWEFAARAGNGSPCWGDGSAILNAVADANLDSLARYNPSTEWMAPYGQEDDERRSCGAEKYTAIVGSRTPNDWGLYDIHGNVWECCLDWFEDDISARDGAVNVDPANPANTLSGAAGSKRVARGGAWNVDASYSRPARRTTAEQTGYDGRNNRGFRLVCTAELK